MTHLESGYNVYVSHSTYALRHGQKTIESYTRTKTSVLPQLVSLINDWVEDSWFYAPSIQLNGPLVHPIVIVRNPF